MSEISDEIKMAEAALSRVLEKLKEVPSKDRTLASKYWLDRVREVRESVKNLQRQGFLFDMIYSRYRRKK